jgi:hypothetical protein
MEDMLTPLERATKEYLMRTVSADLMAALADMAVQVSHGVGCGIGSIVRPHQTATASRRQLQPAQASKTPYTGSWQHDEPQLHA